MSLSVTSSLLPEVTSLSSWFNSWFSSASNWVFEVVVAGALVDAGDGEDW